ncbi:MAG: N-acetyltransferase [Lachnospiraceae bacterium]|nr:N-acetyltransferase [Lachnospiraceae bacterium]
MNKKNWGENIIIGNNVRIGNDVIIKHNCIIEDDVVIGEGTYIDSNTIIRSNTSIGDKCNIGSNCIVGEYWMDFYKEHKKQEHVLTIGNHSLIRSGSIIYAGSEIGNNFQTGHQVTIREKSKIGNNVSIGTLSDIQGNCTIGNYVRLHSNVHIGQLSKIDDYVWIFPYVILTNDPTPPSENFVGVHVNSFAIIATGSIVMPGLEIGQDCLVGAGAIVTKSVKPYEVAVGNPAKGISDVRRIKNKITGEPVYPWRNHFGTYMPWEETTFNEWYDSLDIEDKFKII